MADRVFDTGTDDILVDISDGVMTITLNRPERRNAMSTPMMEGLVAAIADAEVASDVGALVLTGAGGAFCAGGDVKGMAEAGGEGGGSPLQYDARRAQSAPQPARHLREAVRDAEADDCRAAPVQPPGRACRWPSHATCATPRRTRS